MQISLFYRKELKQRKCLQIKLFQTSLIRCYPQLPIKLHWPFISVIDDKKIYFIQQIVNPCILQSEVLCCLSGSCIELVVEVETCSLLHLYPISVFLKSLSKIIFSISTDGSVPVYLNGASANNNFYRKQKWHLNAWENHKQELLWVFILASDENIP